MLVMWCWRCKQEVGMLDEIEYEKIHGIYGQCMEKAKICRKQMGSSLEKPPLADFFKPVTEEYEKITGFKDFHHNAIMHHRISIYGPPCKFCGKPLRTPRAKMCAACGKKVNEGDTMPDLECIYRYMMAFQGVFVRVRSDVKAGENVGLLMLFDKYIKKCNFSYSDIDSLRSDIKSDMNINDNTKEYILTELNANGARSKFENFDKCSQNVIFLRDIIKELVCFLEKEEFERARDLADAAHNYPEFLVTDIWTAKQFWKIYIKPYNRRWKSNFLIEFKQQNNISDTFFDWIK